MSIQIVILAAGQGKRMHSALPKVLHTIGGKSLVEHVVHTAHVVSPKNAPIVICGHQGNILRDTLAYLNVHFVEQEEQLGTGHALAQALPFLSDDDRVLVLYGDVPLISQQTLGQFISKIDDNAIGMLTADVYDPRGYGRIKRDASGKVLGVIEEKDASSDERAITEINSGIYLVPARHLKKWLPQLSNTNVQNEYYLTDIVARAVDENIPVHALTVTSVEEIMGVNDKVQLAALERVYQLNMAETLMRQGVTIRDPHRLDIRGDVLIGTDVVIDVNVILEGNIKIGTGCYIGPNTILRHTQLSDRVEVKANSIIEGAEIAADSVIGPFARLRPGTVIAAGAHVGNFVEIKNSVIGAASKVNHLSYVGDADVGRSVNIGAGTITCNYDGANKHKTVIGDYAFIGSNTELVAPVTIGEGATIGAGSTITHDAPANQLTLARAQQKTIDNWERPTKKDKA